MLSSKKSLNVTRLAQEFRNPVIQYGREINQHQNTLWNFGFWPQEVSQPRPTMYYHKLNRMLKQE